MGSLISCRQRESSECLKALILLDKTGLAAMTFNQVVRGSSPRCLMNERGLQTLIEYRFAGLFVILRYVSFAAGIPKNLSRQRVVKHIFGAVSRQMSSDITARSLHPDDPQCFHAPPAGGRISRGSSCHLHAPSAPRL